MDNITAMFNPDERVELLTVEFTHDLAAFQERMNASQAEIQFILQMVAMRELVHCGRSIDGFFDFEEE